MTTMQVTPRIVSPMRKCAMSLDMDTIMSTSVVPAALTPIKSLICDATISIATADVNPEFTGPEIKSIKKPAIWKCDIIYFNISKQARRGKLQNKMHDFLT